MELTKAERMKQGAMLLLGLLVGYWILQRDGSQLVALLVIGLSIWVRTEWVAEQRARIRVLSDPLPPFESGLDGVAAKLESMIHDPAFPQASR